MRKELINYCMVVVVLLALVMPAAAVDQEKENARKLVEAKNLIWESQYTKARLIFKEIAEMKASSYREEAMYYLAYSSYKLEKNNRALDELEYLFDAYPQGQWRDDAAQLKLDVNRVLGKQGNAVAIIESAIGRNESQRSQASEARAQQREANAQQREASAQQRAARSQYSGALTGGVRVGPRGSYQDDKDCNDEDHIKEAALNALMNADEERAVPILIKFIKLLLPLPQLPYIPIVKGGSALHTGSARTSA